LCEPLAALAALEHRYEGPINLPEGIRSQLMRALGFAPLHTQDVERTFSTVGKVVTKDRTALSDEMIDGLVRVRHVEQSGKRGSTTRAEVNRAMYQAVSNPLTEKQLENARCTVAVRGGQQTLKQKMRVERIEALPRTKRHKLTPFATGAQIQIPPML